MYKILSQCQMLFCLRSCQGIASNVLELCLRWYLKQCQPNVTDKDKCLLVFAKKNKCPSRSDLVCKYFDVCATEAKVLLGFGHPTMQEK